MIGGKLERRIKLKKIKIMVLTLIVLLINTNIGLAAAPTPGNGPLTTVGLNNTVDIIIPSDNGDYFSVSMDNVNWSNWYKKTDFPGGKMNLTLPVGDGYKNVFIKSAVKTVKTFPVYDPDMPNKVVYHETGMPQYIVTGQIVSQKFLFDLTPPTVGIRTPDNLYVAINGNINFILDITDNLDKAPKVKIEVLSRHKTGPETGELLIPKRDENGVIIDPLVKIGTVGGVDDIYSGVIAVAGTVSEAGTSVTIPIRDMEKLVINNRNQSYLFKATVVDVSGNRTVITKQFFVKEVS